MRSGDPVRLALSAAEGQIREGRRLLTKVPDSGLWLGKLDGLLKELRARLEGMPLQPVLDLSPEDSGARGKVGEEEISWRVSEVERAHLAAHRAFLKRTKGIERNGTASLPASILATIRKALVIYDRDLLGPTQREVWKRESRVRAAGIGIYHSPWHTGDFSATNGEAPRDWSGPYLEHDRPWQKRTGKADPVLKFSEIYFTVRDQHEQSG